MSERWRGWGDVIGHGLGHDCAFMHGKHGLLAECRCGHATPNLAQKCLAWGVHWVARHAFWAIFQRHGLPILGALSLVTAPEERLQ